MSIGALLWLSACAGSDLSATKLEEVLETVQDPTDLDLIDSELAAAADGDPSEDLYGHDRLPELRITLSEATDAALRFAPREYAPALLELVDGAETERIEVGLRLKGEGSFQDLDGKPAFRIKIDKYHPGQRLRGVSALTLNNMVQDPSYMAERLAYHVFRELGVPAPRANHARVYVNGAFFGLYANIETPNDDLLARWFADPSRNLYEEGGRDFDHKRGPSSFELETNKDQEDDRASLIALQQACRDSDLARVRELVDWPEFLLFSALEASVNQVDGYSYSQSGPNNYRIYDSERGIVFVPWGLDWAMGVVITQDGGLFVDPFWVRPSHGILMRMCLADGACKAEYKEVLEEVASRWDELQLEGLMDEWADQIREAFETSDQRREGSVELPLERREIRRQYIRGRADALRQQLAAH
jgi:spore coat protein CotH